MSFLIYALRTGFLWLVFEKTGLFTKTPIRGAFIRAFYERDECRFVAVRLDSRLHFVRVAKVQWWWEVALRVTVRHGQHEFWFFPPVENPPSPWYESIFWHWAVTGDRVLGAMIQHWHDAVSRGDELATQRALLLRGLWTLLEALQPLHGSGPSSLPLIEEFVRSIHTGAVNEGATDHQDLLAAVERPLNLGGRQPKTVGGQ